MTSSTPLVLLILDGWGYREETRYNAISAAKTPQWDEWWQTGSHILLDASGESVGLPVAQMGNSEVGHMHIGAGRVIPQDFTRINEAIHRGQYANNPTFLRVINEMNQKKKALHILGLLSPGGVHSHEQHLFAFLQMCAEHDFTDVYLHLFLDGRDTPPKSAELSLKKLKQHLTNDASGHICTISGRYYAMDRDKRWQRLEPVYNLLTQGESPYHFDTVEQALDTFYKQGIHDEFIPPTRIGSSKPIENGDSVFFFNFRADRARELTQALILDQFDGFHRAKQPEIAHFISMTRYASDLGTECVFPPVQLDNTLGKVLADANYSQLRVAETEKYAHVTFFLNGGTEQYYEHEERILIPSPSVATYDLQPEMNAPEVANVVIEAIKNEKYDVIICNFANADMVGHTGNINATIKAIECLDKAMHDIGKAIKGTGGQMLITADHGNAEAMFNDTTNQAHTAHTNNPVPLLYIGEGYCFKSDCGTLIDIAPTLLYLLGIEVPTEMTGHILLERSHV